MVSEKAIFFDFFFFHYKTMGANDSPGVDSLGPIGLIGRIYVENHYTLLHTKYLSCGPHYFREEEYFFFFIISLCKLMTPRGVANLNPGA